jgi:hypothetical protein
MDERPDDQGFAFDFFEVVRVDDSAATPTSREATVLGRTVGNDGIPSYAVAFDTESETVMVAEPWLRRTGRSRRPEDFYSGDSIRVSPDGHLLG